MTKYIYGKWDSYWGCAKCEVYSWHVFVTCPECGDNTKTHALRPIYIKRPWFLPNKFIGYENKRPLDG